MSVSFGTSGLRGPAIDFTGSTTAAYVRAFLDVICSGIPSRTVYLSADLRASSPEIAGHAAAAIVAAGWTPVYAGNVPTPALAAYALARQSPAVMVTGSHIPEDYNGIKFYRPDGEFLKEDEAPVRERAETLLAEGLSISNGDLPPVDPAVAEAYIARYTDAFVGRPLNGLRIGLDLHSAVGRDLTARILEGLGAQVFPFRRSDRFIAVDTEALDPADLSRAKEQISAHHLDAVVSTDGDGDRPLVIDEAGRQVNGDVLGILTARRLGAKTVVTPISSTSAIEMTGWFETVVRTRIGSPYVVAGMAAATTVPVVGFEANGGFLTESDIALSGGSLQRLPTRDAILPMVAALVASAEAKRPLSALVADLPPRVMKADRLKKIAPADGAKLIAALDGSREARVALDPRLAAPVAVDRTDGLRLVLSGGDIVHFRQSGNAPELRCYVETDSAEATDALLADMLAALNRHFAA
ncbi:phosphomannomutase [Pleomorphomonas diazotrophica]|uniref:Phosphomannomutase n=1 Tax=Pleomorphomonas diazotrophica TaxID=1166257 RepID=A0A1I4T0J3_9HYPH|nr:phosphomannomutase [Pleomorphomonas diazotrophica]PKR88657.1 phosphomannomutase [Pleomorphomonas diazotrophica]SFM70254.1 phosphomannomutase [Pleomorphomonas diazotrophica]